MSKETTHFGYETIPLGAKTARVASVFQNVAKQYDLMNDLMSFGLHRLWKRLSIAKANLHPNDSILDLAGGTGDLTLLAAKHLGEKGHIVLADINSAMLQESRKKLVDKGIIKPVSWLQTNAETLPFPERSFDKIFCGFGLRNVTHKDRALKEMHRVLKPGGRVVILEFSKVHSDKLSRCYDLYSFHVLPRLGELICDDRESYQYLAESIRMHPDQETLKSMLLTAGFDQAEYQNIQGGIVALHVGFKKA